MAFGIYASMQNLLIQRRFQRVHEVINVPKSKKEKKENLKKHKQQQREKKQNAKMRKKVSLPAGYNKKK